MIFKEKIYQYSVTHRKTIVRTYDQSDLAWLKAKMFNAFYEFCYLSSCHWLIENICEPLMRGLHSVKCNNDCTTAIDTATDEPIKMCGRFPLCATLDVKHYDLTHKNAFLLKEEIIAVEEL